ncbi:unnamed protein product [Rotaria sp. Silwood2]|nr:unnamed protein product [Rotaria sp. Silwood2]CAF2718811.1 unnamed protein product [Rotaria sp. Silwood2]CAF3897770.1 unnamed protein product [Rotaria sp. Silwood2]CAF3931830.1 unnamed protein product [Rotaria sp. Silwood2]
MNTNQIDNHYCIKIETDEDFKLINTTTKEDPIIAEDRRLRDNEITEKFGEYLHKGYCMANDACPVCNCILLRTPEDQLFCVGCNEINMENKKICDQKKIVTKNKTTDHVKRLEKEKKEKEHVENIDNYNQLENKIQWAVDKLMKIQKPDRIKEMCTVIMNLTKTIEVLKKHETTYAQD